MIFLLPVLAVQFFLNFLQYFWHKFLAKKFSRIITALAHQSTQISQVFEIHNSPGGRLRSLLLVFWLYFGFGFLSLALFVSLWKIDFTLRFGPRRNCVVCSVLIYIICF